jgi:hypothetical protein
MGGDRENMVALAHAVILHPGEEMAKAGCIKAELRTVNVHVVSGQTQPVVGIVELGGRAQDLCKHGRCWQQGRGSLPMQRRFPRGCQIVEDMAMLLLECGDNGHHRFHKLRALRALGPK